MMLTPDIDASMPVWRLKGQLNGYLAATERAISPASGLAVVADWEGAARIYDLASMEEVAVLEGHVGYLTDAHFTTDGKRLVTASTSIERSPDAAESPIWRRDGSVCVWDVASHDEMFYLRPRRLWSAMLSDDGRYLAGVVGRSEVNTIEIWDVDEGRKLALPPALVDQTPRVKPEDCCVAVPNLLAISPNGQLFVTGMHEEVRFWSTQSPELVAAVTMEVAAAVDVHFGGPELFAILSGWRHPLCRFDIHLGQIRWRLDGEFVGAKVLCLCPDTGRLAVRLPSAGLAVLCSETGTCIFRVAPLAGSYWGSWSAGILATDYKCHGAELVDGTTGMPITTLSPNPPPTPLQCGDGIWGREGPCVALAMERGILLTGRHDVCVWELVS